MAKRRICIRLSPYDARLFGLLKEYVRIDGRTPTATELVKMAIRLLAEARRVA